MAFIDPFEERRRRINELFRDALRRIEELEASLINELVRLSDELEYERILDERISMLSSGAIEPLYQIVDRGDSIQIIVDMPGAVGETVNVYISESEVRVEAKIDEEAIRRAFRGFVWAGRVERYSWTYRLPFRIDPSRASWRLAGSRVIITVPKS